MSMPTAEQYRTAAVAFRALATELGREGAALAVALDGNAVRGGRLAAQLAAAVATAGAQLATAQRDCAALAEECAHRAAAAAVSTP